MIVGSKGTRAVTSQGFALPALLFALAGCGGAVASGSVVGKVGRGLGAHAQTTPQAAEVCALKEGLAAQPGGSEKPLAESCGKQLKSDQLWRRVLVVLAAYGETLDEVASGGRSDSTGRLQAARTGVQGKDWIQVDGAPEQAARDAAGQLVEIMDTKASKDDLDKLVQEAAPSVRAMCQGLVPYLDEQARGFGDVEKEIEKKRAAKGDHRCATLDNRTICVGESSTDRVVYGHALGQLVIVESNHADARAAATGFCAAHEKLAEAASKGNLSDSATFRDVIEAVRVSSQSGAAAAPPSPPKK